MFVSRVLCFCFHPYSIAFPVYHIPYCLWDNTEMWIMQALIYAMAFFKIISTPLFPLNWACSGINVPLKSKVHKLLVKTDFEIIKNVTSRGQFKRSPSLNPVCPNCQNLPIRTWPHWVLKVSFSSIPLSQNWWSLWSLWVMWLPCHPWGGGSAGCNPSKPTEELSICGSVAVQFLGKC